MQLKNSLFVVLICAIILTFLFYNQGIGLNVLIFEIILLAWLVISKQLTFKHNNEIICIIGVLLTGVFTIINYSFYTYFIHFVTLFLFVGVLNYTEVRSLVTSFGISLYSLFNSQGIFLKSLFGLKVKGEKANTFFWKSRIFIIPLAIIVVFIIIYSSSSPKFSKLVTTLLEAIDTGMSFLFKDINIVFILTFLISLFISTFLLLRSANKDLVLWDSVANEDYIRKKERVKRHFKLNALKNEYKAGIFLLVVLNIIILIVNGMDIYWVWFNFEWTGQTLKQFVHEGTYLLILSILISIVVVLYFFRGNLNFYKNNKFLKLLSYVWLFQNGILAVSVAIRNYRYIEYFALAYKRIGVIIFLLLTMYGLYSVFRKIKFKKTAFYLFKWNTLALYLILVFTSLINWDIVIAKYNFAHSHHSYIHLEYLVTLSDKALPYLNKSKTELSEIESIQRKKFYSDEYTMTYIQYRSIIKRKTLAFKQKWEGKKLLAWNLAEYRAYRALLDSDQ